LPVEHYENFPVASWLLPASMREPIEALYGFARGADDVADEGDAPDAQRLASLDQYLAACDAMDAGLEPAPRFARIAAAVRRYHLPVELLRDLIDAFKQDVVKKRYATFDELLDYSRRSANPVGRLVLQIGDAVGIRPRCPEGTAGFVTRIPTASPVLASDNICSALQLINFWQDVEVDWRKGRVYIPQEDLARFGVSEARIAAGDAGGRWSELMRFECERARRMLYAGWPLARDLPGRMGLEIRATIGGGAIILDRIEAAEGDVFRHRPVLRAPDWVRILARALLKKGPPEASVS
jgi:phytoene/squalene synthetase